MRVLFVTPEAYPLAKTGGLADVSHALPLALTRRGVDVRVLLPAYPSALARVERPRVVAKLGPILGIEDATLISGWLPETQVPVILLDAPALYRREGGLYQGIDGQDWADNARRFAFLSHVGAGLAMGRAGIGWRPEVVHANDWHTGLLPLLLSREDGPRPGTLFTAHNMAFQGNFPADDLSAIGVPEECYATGDIEFYGQVSFLKAGLRFADRVTTVSPTYAKEILTSEYGFGMDGVLRARGDDFTGVLNGIDDACWNPETDSHLPQTFGADDVAGKRACKAVLQHQLGLPVSPETPLFGFVNRLTHQKMVDVVLAALPWITEQGAQFVLLGQGDKSFEVEFAQAQARFPESIAVRIGYDEALAHRLQAGCDILLAPARFEPCGLTQLYALRYGTLPIVRRTGGLADTVVNATPATIADKTATGFSFDNATTDALISTLGRAVALFREPLKWRRLQLQGMAQDFSWNASAGRYVSLYREIGAAPTAEAVALMAVQSVAEEKATQIAG